MDVKDVELALQFARENKLPFNVKGGGHSAAGYCLNDGGVVIDMFHLNNISFNKKDETVRVGMGARWKDVYEHMEDTHTGLIPVGGGCPTVGPAGFMLGGGYSFVSRSYGMSIDNLLSLTIVTPDGKRRVVGVDSKSSEDKDLFWACQGGGGGNYGIVTEMHMRVRRPNTARMLVGQIHFPIERAVEVIDYYNKWVETLPNQMAVYGRWGKIQDSQIQSIHDDVIKRRRPPDEVNPKFIKKLKTLSFTPVYNGPFAEGMEMLQGLLKFAPLASNIFQMTLPQWEAYNGYSTLVANRSSYIKSLMLKPLHYTADVAKVFVKYMSSPDDEFAPPNNDSFVVWTHGGGEIGKRSSEETSFWHRDARFIPELKTIWDFDKPGEREMNVEWSNRFFDELTRVSRASGAYVNYIDPLLHNWQEKYYGKNYARLLKIKKKVDPYNVFAFQQGIGSTFNPSPFAKGVHEDLAPLDRTQV
jgi:hypothetical protein